MCAQQISRMFSFSFIIIFSDILNRMAFLEPDLSERYNDGLVPQPEVAGEPPARLQRPAWQPTAAQVEAAHAQTTRSIIILGLLVVACLLLLALALGWRP